MLPCRLHSFSSRNYSANFTVLHRVQLLRCRSTKVEIFVGSNNIRVGYLLVVVDPTLFLKSEFQLGNIYTCKRACSLPVSFSCHASPSKKGKTVEIKRYAFT